MSVMTGPRGIPSTTRNAPSDGKLAAFERGATRRRRTERTPKWSERDRRARGAPTGSPRCILPHPGPRRRRKMFARTTVAAASLFCCLGARPAGGQIRDAARFYHLTRTIKVAGDGGWDYVTADATARRVYVAHATRVVVLDMDNGVVVGEIANTPGVHGIAVAPELGRGFTSNGADSSVTIFDLRTLATLMVVKTTG